MKNTLLSSIRFLEEYKKNHKTFAIEFMMAEFATEHSTKNLNEFQAYLVNHDIEISKYAITDFLREQE